MFQLNPRGSYMMPAHFGPRTSSPKASGWYRDVTMMVVPYVTDAEKLSAYIPEPFRLTEHPIITVVYARNREIDWLAGRGYNLVHVMADVVYQGEKEELTGKYTLVMWENLTDPILTGREMQGIPKVFADIPDHTITDDGEWQVNASHFGNKIVDLSVSGLRTPTEEEVAAAEAAKAKGEHPMAWRFFPEIPGFGAAINEKTTFPSETHIKEAWVGEGSIEWQHLTWEQNPTQCHIVNALADLPVVMKLPAMVAKGSVNLILPENLPRVLK
jgi:acetoacetate decarboxylase